MAQRQQYRNQPASDTNGNGKDRRNAPVFKLVAPASNGTIEIAVFENEFDGRNGKTKTYSTSVGRNYCDDDNKWTNGSKSFRSSDLPILALLLQQAFMFILDQRKE